MEIQEMWAILEVDERDYLLWWDNSSVISIDELPQLNGSQYEYNQLEYKQDYWSCLCTCYASIWMYSNNNNLKIDWETRLNLVKDRVAQPDFNKNTWGYLAVGVNRVVNYFNNGIVYRISKNDIKKLLNKWYTINIWLYVWNDLNSVAQDKEITADEISLVKDKKYWHSTLIKWDSRQNSYVWLKENNITKIDDLDKFINSWFVFDWAYLIVSNKTIRDYFNNLLNTKSKLEWFKFYDEISKDLYPREKNIFQYCLQMKYIWKINTPELKNLVF